MGVKISRTEACFEFNNGKTIAEKPRQVLSLAERSLTALFAEGVPENISHLIVATTCPDMLSPSLGQMINERFSAVFSDCHTVDVVQGCAGGVTALILGSQLAALNRSTVVVVQADAAQKASSTSSSIHRIFGNGSFASLMEYDDTDKGLLHYKSKQFAGLSEVVTVSLGHDAHQVIMNHKTDLAHDPRKYLGLRMNNALALQLLRHAESFYIDFVNASTQPDVMILHQVNPDILRHLRAVFSKYNVEFVDSAAETGNCGAASVGIALHHTVSRMAGRKILLCSFGTGGVITAGLWQL